MALQPGLLPCRVPTGSACHGCEHARVLPSRLQREVKRRNVAVHGYGTGPSDSRRNLSESCASGVCGDLDAEWQALQRPMRLLQQPPTGSIRGVSAQDCACGTEPSTSGCSLLSLHSLDECDVDGSLHMPFPCNSPANEVDQELSELAELWSKTGQPGIDLLASGSICRRMPEVYVILFGVGQKDTEGIYSLRGVSDEGLPTETIVAFESEVDAERYSGLLEAAMEHRPNVCSIAPGELLDFCKDSGYQCQLELEGSLLFPPDYNVHVTDWERSLKLKEGYFGVLDDEPEHSLPTTMGDADPFGSSSFPAAAVGASCPVSFSGISISSSSRPVWLPGSQLPRQLEFTHGELESIRAKLELLLPDGSFDAGDGGWDSPAS